MTDAPKRPWERGRHEEYACASLEVKIVEDTLGWVFSEHQFLSGKDEAVAGSMRNGGLKQIAYALMTEALRREAYLCLLVEMSKHPDMLKWYEEGGEDYRKQFVTGLANAALVNIMGMAQKMLPDIAREVVLMGVSQMKGSEKPPSE